MDTWQKVRQSTPRKGTDETVKSTSHDTVTSKVGKSRSSDDTKVEPAHGADSDTVSHDDPGKATAFETPKRSMKRGVRFQSPTVSSVSMDSGEIEDESPYIYPVASNTEDDTSGQDLEKNEAALQKEREATLVSQVQLQEQQDRHLDECAKAMISHVAAMNTETPGKSASTPPNGFRSVQALNAILETQEHTLTDDISFCERSGAMQPQEWMHLLDGETKAIILVHTINKRIAEKELLQAMQEEKADFEKGLDHPPVKIKFALDRANEWHDRAKRVTEAAASDMMDNLMHGLASATPIDAIADAQRQAREDAI